MKKLVMLLLVLALCAPCFGSILVYKQSGSTKGLTLAWNDFERDVYIEDEEDEDPCDANQLESDTTTLTSSQDAKGKIAGYIVMDVNISTLLINDLPLPDTNANNLVTLAAAADGVAMILVDKKAKTFKVIRNVQVAWSLDAGILVGDSNYGSIDAEGMYKAEQVLSSKGKVTKKTLAWFDVDGYLSSNLSTDLDPGDKDVYTDQAFGLGSMTGALKKVDIDGSKTKVLVPTTLKGHGYSSVTEGIDIYHSYSFEWGSASTYSDIYTETQLDGNAKMTLDKKATKAANQSTPTTLGTTQTLVNDLEADGYTKVLPPAIPYFD
jgi:hypothetical protein